MNVDACAKSGSQGRHAAEALASGLPPLMLAAERVAATVAQGVHGRRRVGPGHSFWQFRPYVAGDATGRIDWRETAKSDRTFIREQEWDAAQTAFLWAASGPAMAWRSSQAVPTKRERATILLLGLAALLLRAGEHVGLLGSTVPPQLGRAVLRRLCSEVDLPAPPGPSFGTPPFATVPRHAALILFSDWLDPAEATREIVAHYTNRGLRGHLVQILDPAEADLPYEGRVRFEGVAREAGLLVNRVEQLRGAYRQRLAAHNAELGRLARGAGWSFTSHRTDRPAAAALLQLWAALADDGSGRLRARG